MEDWTRSSILTTNLELEICYLISDHFFIGDGNDHSQFLNKDLNVPIKPPKVDREVTGIATTKEVLNNENHLAEYYKTILELKTAHNKSYNDIHHLFWLRLWIFNIDQTSYISFPWYDTVNEFKRFFRIFDDDKTGQLFFDGDQGWQIEVEADNDFYYLRESNPDENNAVFQNIKIDKKALKTSIKELETAIDTQIEKLTTLVGIDLWTNREYIKENIDTKIYKEFDVKKHNKIQLRNIKKISSKKKQKKIKNLINISTWIILFVAIILMEKKLISWIIPALLFAYVLTIEIVKNVTGRNLK